MTENGIPGLAAKLDHLFKSVAAPTRSGLYSNDTAASALQKRGVNVSGVHLSHLRSGRRDNPSASLLAALADLLGVPIAYFFDIEKEQRFNAELDALSALRDPGAKKLLLLARGVSPPNVDRVAAILVQIRQIEGLGSDDDA